MPTPHHHSAFLSPVPLVITRHTSHSPSSALSSSSSSSFTHFLPNPTRHHPPAAATKPPHTHPPRTVASATDANHPAPPASSTPSPQTTATATSTPDHEDAVFRLFRRHAHLPPATKRAIAAVFGRRDVTVVQETCFNVAVSAPLSAAAMGTLCWLLAETYDPSGLSDDTFLSSSSSTDVIIEVGPRLNFQTAWSSNAVSICRACAIPGVTRIERSRRYLVSSSSSSSSALTDSDRSRFADRLHDRMTETVYTHPLRTFRTDVTPVPSYDVDVLGPDGRDALVRASERDGLGFDEQDLDYYYRLFATDMKRNPTNVELFDLAQSNSEHSRHWFFKGRLVVDGVAADKHLFDMVRDTLRTARANNPRDNSVIAFADNSSTIRGGDECMLVPVAPGCPGPLQPMTRDRDVLFTAETHNFPSGVAPFPGAETGTGGRIRDTAATGIGSLVGVATAGYAVGHLNIPDHAQPWETDARFQYPTNLAAPLDILIGASDGASDYGNKFGEPVINGFARSYGLRLPDGQRREYVKPIMFSGGMGQMEHAHAHKGDAAVGLLVVKVGGPAYRIGMGGGAASSMMQGDNRADLDFNAVQRGDAEMASKVYRVLRACVELGPQNPIVSIHDQGAGGNCNVVKELIYPAGATIHLRNILVGDATLSALEVWGAEYQEQFGLLLRPEHRPLFDAVCARENVTAAVLGTVDGSGRIVLWDDAQQRNVVDLDLDAVLGDLPQKTFTDARVVPLLEPFAPPAGTGVADVLTRVLSLMTVGSKRFLTTKVDRSVSGLVAQQQCVGPLQLPLCGYGVAAVSILGRSGSATAVGERPALTSVNPAAMARVSVAEALLNLAGARVSSRLDIKCEANWMWAAKLPGDCASLTDAAAAMCDAMVALGLAVDGGKDSLSMAARCPGHGKDEDALVRAPGTLVVSAYCTVPDISRKLTPDLKRSAANSVVLHIDLSAGRRRTGGSAAALVFSQLGDIAPDVDNMTHLAAAFDIVQSLIVPTNTTTNNNNDVNSDTSTSTTSDVGADADQNTPPQQSSPEKPLVLAYHDVSDGGLLTALLEMAFAGNCGLDVDVASARLAPGVDTVAALFAEEPGMLLEVDRADAHAVARRFHGAGIACDPVARTRPDFALRVRDNGVDVMAPSDMRDWRDVWEATSFALERQQADVSCVAEEQAGLRDRVVGPSYIIPPTLSPVPLRQHSNAASPKQPPPPRVAIIREEGSNGDREMSAAFHLAGFDVWDVATRDLAAGRVSLDAFSGVAFVGGFSFADVLDSAKGWAGVARFNDAVRDELARFFARRNTFSLGVCNGCQLMALMGTVPFGTQSSSGIDWTKQARFVHNKSGRYESRFCTVAVHDDSPAIMLRGMGGARLGVWVAHGEGQALFPNDDDHNGAVVNDVLQGGLAPLRYVDDDGHTTTRYPANPNGSAHGIAALCSPDGRHLAMMPHPERCVRLWQWPYTTEAVRDFGDGDAHAASPWLNMFRNAYDWAVDVGYTQPYDDENDKDMDKQSQ